MPGSPYRGREVCPVKEQIRSGGRRACNESKTLSGRILILLSKNSSIPWNDGWKRLWIQFVKKPFTFYSDTAAGEFWI